MGEAKVTRVRVVLSEAAATRREATATRGEATATRGEATATRGETAATRRPVMPRQRPAGSDQVGEELVEGLVRAQLALAVRLSLVVAAGLGALPLLFAVAPAVGGVTVLGVKLPWLLLGLLSFPFLVLVGWAYVHWAERNEQDFVAVVARPEE